METHPATSASRLVAPLGLRIAALCAILVTGCFSPRANRDRVSEQDFSHGQQPRESFAMRMRRKNDTAHTGMTRTQVADEVRSEMRQEHANDAASSLADSMFDATVGPVLEFGAIAAIAAVTYPFYKAGSYVKGKYDDKKAHKLENDYQRLVEAGRQIESTNTQIQQVGATELHEPPAAHAVLGEIGFEN